MLQVEIQKDSKK